MRVIDVLSRKGSHVAVVHHQDSLRDAVGIMHVEDIGAVVVLNAHSKVPIGILSQAEVMRALREFGPHPLKQEALGFMRKPPPQCRGDTKISAALAQVTRDRARHLLVLDENEALLGLVSLGDLVAARVQNTELERNVLRDMAQSHLLAGSA
jgi:CBS domain-containing protein